ncbi:MAG: DUF4388 domain-containing protein [Planctomycetota bacterium]
MKLQSDLENIGLTDLFKILTEQHATGVLSITSLLGSKHIALQDATLTIFTDKLSKRMRLGDLLITRGVLTEMQLTEALRDQRKSEPPSKLGVCLIKKDFITADRIKQALKFQLEEEFFDLFTWQNASFSFDSDETIKDIAAEAHSDMRNTLTVSLEGVSDFFDPTGLTPSINLQTLIAETTRYLPEWQNIQKRLPTPYLCFQLTAKADEMATYAPRGTQHVLKLIKEGRTIETTVKGSCLGRFEVYKILIKALDDGWIFPYPASKLRWLAAEHCIQKRFFDALNIYRRLLESAQQSEEQRQLQEMIDDTTGVILRANVSGDEQDIGEAISYKAAAEQYRRRRRYRRIGLGGLVFFSFALIVYLVLRQYAPIAELVESYRLTILASEQAISAGDFDRAMDILNNLYKSIPDKESDIAKRTLEQLKFLSQQLDLYVTDRLQFFEAMEQKGQWGAAEAGYNRLLAQYPKSRQAVNINANLSRIQAKRDALAREELLARLRVKLQEALDLLQKKQFTAAKAKFQGIVVAAPPETSVKRDAQTELQKLAQLEKRVQALLAAAEKELGQKRGEKALIIYEEAIAIWPDLPINQQAREESVRIRARLEQVHITLKEADIEDQQDDVIATAETLRRLEKQYPEFELTANLRPRITELEDRAKFAQKQLEQTQATFVTDKSRGRLAYVALIKRNTGYLISQKIEIPVCISASPQALLKINGQTVGLTPQEVKLPIHLPVTLSLEKQGYQTCERRITRLMPDDVEIHLRLKRKAVQVLDFNESIFTPPCVIADTLYVLHGAALSAFDLTAQKKLWSLDQLLDDQARPRPLYIIESHSPEIVGDKSWWYPRQSPEPYTEDSLLLPLRSHDILEINLRKPTVKKLLTLSSEPLGIPYFDRSVLSGDRVLLAIAGTDGKIRGFDLAQPSTPIWEKALDPATSLPQGALAAGLAPRNGGAFVALSAGGRLVLFSAIDGRELWSLDLKAPIAENNRLPRLPSEHFAVLTHTNGAISAVDLNQRVKVWTLPTQRVGDEAFSAITDQKNVYMITREGLIRKYARDRQNNPAALWQRSLDGAAELPLLCGNLLYVVSSFGTVYAIALDDGRVVWDYRMERKPSQMSLHGAYLYLTTPDGRLHVINAE